MSNGMLTPEIRKLFQNCIQVKEQTGKRLVISYPITQQDIAIIERLPGGHIRATSPEHLDWDMLRELHITQNTIPNPSYPDFKWIDHKTLKKFAIATATEHIHANQEQVLRKIRAQNPSIGTYARILRDAYRNATNSPEEQEIQIAARAMVEEAKQEGLLDQTIWDHAIRSALLKLIDEETEQLSQEIIARKSGGNYTPPKQINISEYNAAVIGRDEIQIARKRYPAALAWMTKANKAENMPRNAEDMERIAREGAEAQGLIPEAWEQINRLPTRRAQEITQLLCNHRLPAKFLNEGVTIAREFREKLPQTQEEFERTMQRLEQDNGKNSRWVPQLIMDLSMESSCPKVRQWTRRHIRSINTNRFLIAQMPQQHLRDLELHNPGALVTTMGLGNFSRVPNHPGEIIVAARTILEKAGLNSRSWRTAATMPAVLMRNIVRTGGTAEETAAAVELIVQAQAVPAPAVIRTLGRKKNFTATRKNPNCQQAAVLIIRESAKRLAENPKAREQRDLQGNISDLIDYANSLGEDPALRARTFQGLSERSRQWHRDLTEHLNRAEWKSILKQQDYSWPAWNSLTGPIQEGDLTVTPLCDQKQLFDESKDMRHCVAVYYHYCKEGKSRIFSVNREGVRIATGEISLAEEEWVITQIKSRRNQPAPLAAQQALKKMCDRYNQAWKRNPQHRSWTISASATDGKD